MAVVEFNLNTALDNASIIVPSFNSSLFGHRSLYEFIARFGTPKSVSASSAFFFPTATANSRAGRPGPGAYGLTPFGSRSKTTYVPPHVDRGRAGSDADDHPL